MNLLALDIATCTGWCSGIAGGDPIFGHRLLALPGASPGVIFVQYRDWLCWQLDTLRPDRVIAEDQFLPKSERVAQRLYGLRAITLEVAERRNLRLSWLPIGTVSRFLTGRGRWPDSESKKAATMRACEAYGFHPAQDDEGDALALWLCAEAQEMPGLRRSAGMLFARAG